MAKEKAQKAKKQRGGARGNLRTHFLANIGRVMDSDELRVVANNQSEWARRVRELRTEEGFLILTHNDRSELKPGHNQPLSGQFQKKPVRMSSTAMVSLVKCAAQSRENLILTTQHARHASTSGTSSTKAKAAVMSPPIFAQFVPFVTRVHKMPHSFART